MSWETVRHIGMIGAIAVVIVNLSGAAAIGACWLWDIYKFGGDTLE